MSLRHLKSTVTASCLVVTAALSTASVSMIKSGLPLPEMTQIPAQATELAFRASGRISDEEPVAFRASGRMESGEPVAYRASGRFHSSIFKHTLLSYRASERGLELLAYRASGRFNSNAVGNRLLTEPLPQEQTVAYRASGRFQSGSGQEVISYRGSERGVDAVSG